MQFTSNKLSKNCLNLSLLKAKIMQFLVLPWHRWAGLGQLLDSAAGFCILKCCWTLIRTAHQVQNDQNNFLKWYMNIWNVSYIELQNGEFSTKCSARLYHHNFDFLAKTIPYKHFQTISHETVSVKLRSCKRCLIHYSNYCCIVWDSIGDNLTLSRPRGSPLTSKIVWRKIYKCPVRSFGS